MNSTKNFYATVSILFYIFLILQKFLLLIDEIII